MAFLDRFRRPQKSIASELPPRDPDTVLAYYLSPGGQLDAIKTGLAYPGAGNYMYGITSPYADIPITSNPTGFAYASIVSTWANKCIEIRKTIINRIPWSVVDRRTGKPIPGHPFEVAVRRANARGQKIFMLHEWAQCIWGETFLWPVKNEFGYHSDLVWLNNLGMEVLTLAGLIGGYSYAPITGGRVKQFKPGELVFYYTDNPFNNLRGVSPFDTILLEVGVDKDIARHLKAWYSNNARPGLMLIPENDTSVFASQEFMDFWKANFQGPANAGKPVLMPSMIKDIKEIQESPKIDDIEQRLAVRTEICARFGVPLAIAGAWDDANYDSVDTQRKSLYEETIIPETETIDDDFTERLLPFFDEWGTARIVHDFTNIKALMEDEGQKANAVNQRLVSGGITLNEYREQFDLPKLPNGNVYYLPAGITVTPADQLGKQPAPIAPPSPVQAPAQAPQLPTSIETPKPPQLPSGESPERPAVQPPPGIETKADELPAPIIKAQSTPADELAAWEKKYKNGGAKKAVNFDSLLIRPSLADMLRSALLTTDNDVIKAAFKSAYETLAIKAVQGTRLDFEGEFEDLLDRARTDRTDRRAFSATLRYFLNKFGRKAYLDGLQDGGVDTDELDDEDKAQIALLLSEQSRYVSEFGAVLFKGEGVTDFEAANKPTLWFNKSIMPMYQAGLTSADQNGLYEWVYGDTEHCDTCKALNGQKHRLKDYARRDLLPQSSLLECGGFNCACKLVKSSGKAVGSWPVIAAAA